MNPRAVLTSAFLVVAWTMFAATPAHAENYKTREKCNVDHYGKAFLKANVASMSWSGACVKGKAEGKGLLLVTMKDASRVDRYDGEMHEGRIEGEGAFSELKNDKGLRIAGKFSFGTLDHGKLYNDSGRLVFEGSFHRIKLYAPRTVTIYGPREGKVFFLNGSYIDGGFLKGTQIFDTSMNGLAYGVLYDSRGVMRRRVVKNVDYPLTDDDGPNGLDYHSAVFAYSTELMGAEIDADIAENAAAAAEDEQRKARDRSQTAQITAAAVGVAGAIVAPNSGTARATAPAPTPAARAAAERPMQTAVASAASCVSYQGLEHRLGYQYQQVTNTCGFGILVAYEIRVNGVLREYDGAGGHIFAGQTNKSSFGRLASDRWTATFKYACPDKEEVERQTGRRVANANWQAGRGCYATFENDPVGVVR